MNKTMFSQFIKKPMMTGAVCASSPELAQMLTSAIGLESAETVAELGPGTGAVTGTILQKIPGNCRFFTVELNEEVLLEFQKAFPCVRVYHDSAANLHNIIKKEKITSLDCIISGLPWSIFPEQLQKDILSAIVDTLSPDGSFTTFSYLQSTLLPRGHLFYKLLKSFFVNVDRSPIVWKNLPPAFVYRCSKK
jgi:phospholipid N-methyltransferase